MKNYLLYDDQGAILQTGRCPESMLELQGSPGKHVLAGTADQLTEYVVDGVILTRPVMVLALSKETAQADGVDEIILSGLPAGANVYVRGPADMDGQADGGPAVLTFALAGAYTAYITHFPYQDAKVTMHAT